MAKDKVDTTRIETPKAASIPKGKEKEEIKGPSLELRTVGVDTSEEDVIKYDTLGHRLQFEVDPGRFRELSEEAIKGLSKGNRTNYFVSKQLADKLQEHKDGEEKGMPNPDKHPPLRILGRRPRGALDVKSTKEWERKWHPCWKRMDEASDSIEEGYTPIHADEPVKTPGARAVGGTRRITKSGVDELIALKIPKEHFQEHLRAVGEESRRRRSSARDDFKEKALQVDKDSKPFDKSSETVSTIIAE